MTDAVLLYGSTALVLLLNILLIRSRKWYGIGSMSVQLLYSGYCYYWYFYEDFHTGTGGMAFAAYMLELFCNCFLIVVVIPVCYFFQAKR